MSAFWYVLRNYAAIAAAICSTANVAVSGSIRICVITAVLIVTAIYANYRADKELAKEKVNEYLEHLKELEAMTQQAGMELSRLKLFREYEGGRT